MRQRTRSEVRNNRSKHATTVSFNLRQENRRHRRRRKDARMVGVRRWKGGENGEKGARVPDERKEERTLQMKEKRFDCKMKESLLSLVRHVGDPS